jgi:hypothetical protein
VWRRRPIATTTSGYSGGSAFGDGDIKRWHELLRKAAREKNPVKLAAALALIESAARQEQGELRRRIGPNVQQYQVREAKSKAAKKPPAPPVPSNSNQDVARSLQMEREKASSAVYLKYLELADRALADNHNITKT